MLGGGTWCHPVLALLSTCVEVGARVAQHHNMKRYHYVQVIDGLIDSFYWVAVLLPPLLGVVPPHAVAVVNPTFCPRNATAAPSPPEPAIMGDRYKSLPRGILRECWPPVENTPLR